MPELIPVFPSPPLAVDEEARAPGPEYGRAWMFDFERGDFVLDGAGRPVWLDGHAAWAQWCVKAVLVERLAHPIYTPAYGIERVRVAGDRAAVEAEIARAITEALMADTRTAAVRDFTYAWDGDGVQVGFEVVPVVGTAQRVEVKLRG